MYQVVIIKEKIYEVVFWKEELIINFKEISFWNRPIKLSFTNSTLKNVRFCYYYILISWVPVANYLNLFSFMS